MANLGKLGTALIATIEDLIANGPSEEGDKEDRADALMTEFLSELDAIYVDNGTTQEVSEGSA